MAKIDFEPLVRRSSAPVRHDRPTEREAAAKSDRCAAPGGVPVCEPAAAAGRTGRQTQRLRRHLLWLSAIAVFLVVLIHTAWLCDDAYTSYRTADNFVHGYGLTWNVHERVQAYTHPLWLLLFSATYLVTGEAYYTAIFLSIAVSLSAVTLLAWKVARSCAAAAMGVLALCLSIAFVDYSTSGLENPLTHLILVLFLWVYLREEYPNPGRRAGPRRFSPAAAAATVPCRRPPADGFLLVVVGRPRGGKSNGHRAVVRSPARLRDPETRSPAMRLGDRGPVVAAGRVAGLCAVLLRVSLSQSGLRQIEQRPFLCGARGPRVLLPL